MLVYIKRELSGRSLNRFPSQMIYLTFSKYITLLVSKIKPANIGAKGKFVLSYLCVGVMKIAN